MVIFSRDCRIKGAKKLDFQKMGAAHCFFFFEAPIFIFFISWALRPLCAHQFFFFEVPITLKKNHGQFAPRFLCIFLYIRKLFRRSDFFEKKNWNKKLNWGSAPIKRPLFFFYFSAHYLRKKIMGVRPSCAHEFFFFRP